MSVSMLVLAILGVICILYGILVRMIGSGTLFFAVWLAIGFISLLLSWLLRVHFFDRLPRAVRIIFIALVAAGILSVCISEAFILRGFRGDRPEKLEYLIVLGAQVREDGPSTVLRYRLDTAAAYMWDHEDVICIVSGGQGYNEPTTEGAAMKKYLVERGIDASRIAAEEKAVNTVQNIRFSREYLSSPDAPVGIVTNNFHVARAKALAKKQGLTEVYGIAAPSDPVYLVNNMFREALGVMKDFVRGNL